MDKRKRYTTVVILLIVVALAAGAVLIRKHRAAAVQALPGVPAAPWALHSITVQRGPLSNEFLALAKVIGVTEITVSSQISGTIDVMGPREGARVSTGDLLARISVQELQEQRAALQAQLISAEADVTRTRDEFERQKKLLAGHLTSKELFESKKTAALSAQQKVRSLQREIAALQVRIGYGTVYAPADAVVAKRLAEPGDNAQSGTALYQLTVDSAARLQVTLPQQIVEQVHVGTSIVLDYASRQLRVQVSRIFPALDSRALGTVEADIAHMPFGLASGSRIPARVVLQSVDNVLAVPHQAILQRGRQGTVFKVTHGEAGNILHRIEVSVGLVSRSAVEVSSAQLHAGDQLVVAHESILLQLRDGEPVIAVPTADSDRASITPPAAPPGDHP